jgi:hypothetical protein
MHEYDIALKSILMRLAGSVLEELTGFAVARWRGTELPEVRNPRVDLLGETAGGQLVHIELQSTNDADMALRMAEYAWAIYRRLRRFPEQLVLYVGEAPLRMARGIEGRSVSVKYRLMDIRELPAEPFLASNRLEDNVIAVLMGRGGQRGAVRRILWRIADTEPERRGTALAELLILAGLRSLTKTVSEEVQSMPILNDIMDHAILGPKIREGMEKGERQILLRLAEKRFGPVPSWAKQRIDAMSAAEIEHIALRLLDAASLEDLLSSSLP